MCSHVVLKVWFLVFSAVVWTDRSGNFSYISELWSEAKTLDRGVLLKEKAALPPRGGV